MTPLDRAKALIRFPIGAAFFDYKRAHDAACRADQDASWNDNYNQKKLSEKWQRSDTAEDKFLTFLENLIKEYTKDGTTQEPPGDTGTTQAQAPLHDEHQQGEPVRPASD